MGVDNYVLYGGGIAAIGVARAKFINSVAVQAETDNNSTQSSSGVSQEEIFAQGLPNWDPEPPQAVARRICKK